MAAEITAWFENIDAAENAARELRRRGKGIRSLRIRQPKQQSRTPGDAMWAAMALYATPVGQSVVSGSAGLPITGFFPDALEGESRPPAHNREDCLMVLTAEDSAARFDAALLTALHAGHLHMVPHMPG